MTLHGHKTFYTLTSLTAYNKRQLTGHIVSLHLRTHSAQQL